MLTITARAADVDRAFRCGDPGHPRAHSADQASDFGRSLTPVGEFDQGLANLIIGHLAIEHPPEQCLGVPQRQAHAATPASSC